MAQDVLNNLLLFGIAFCTMITTVVSVLTRMDMRKVEVATNSIKDALIKSTDEAAFARGHHEARLEGEHKAEVIAAKNEMPAPAKVDVVAAVPITIAKE